MGSHPIPKFQANIFANAAIWHIASGVLGGILVLNLGKFGGMGFFVGYAIFGMTGWLVALIVGFQRHARRISEEKEQK